MLAARRILRAIGRINVLTTSMRTRKGAKAIGALRGKKWATSSLGPEKKVKRNLASQKQNPSLNVSTLEVVRLITEGTKPKKFAVRIV